MAGNRRSNVVRYRKPLRINIGQIIYGIILIYIVCCVVLYFTKTHVTIYEVQLGSLAKNNSYTGIILREESVVHSDYAGYINYYARENEKVGVGNSVYTIDETGKLSNMIADRTSGESVLNDKDFAEVRTEIMNFSHTFSKDDFRSVYDFKYSMNGAVLKMMSMNVMNTLDELTAENGTSMLHIGTAQQDGILVYSTDGYESLTADSFTAESFDQANYEKVLVKSNDLVNKGDPVYKVITSEKWSVIIPIEEERLPEIEEESYLEVEFLKDSTKAWGALTILRKDGGVYAKLDFENSMIRFATDRFINIELLLDEKVGLKIPVTSVIEREFYTIPKDYITFGGDSSVGGFMKESYQEDGTLTTEYVETDIYHSTDTEYYIDKDQFSAGEYIIKPDSTEKYPISKTATLVGVFNVNKGYADFKQVTVLYQNEEYCIVQPNNPYSLSVYDHIILDATTVIDKEILY